MENNEETHMKKKTCAFCRNCHDKAHPDKAALAE